MDLRRILMLQLLLASAVLMGCDLSAENQDINENPDSSEPANANLPPEISGVSRVTKARFSSNNQLSLEYIWSARAEDSDGSIASYSWQIMSEQPIQFEGLSTMDIRFTYPPTSSEEPDIVIMDLIVTDNEGAQATLITEYDLNDFVMVAVFPKDANPGQEVQVPATIWGRRSKIETFSWSIYSDHNITLLDANKETVSFVAPSGAQNEEIVLMLEVTDTNGTTGRYFTTITVIE